MTKIMQLTDPLSEVWIEAYKEEIMAGIERSSYLPVTSFKELNETITVEDVHPLDTGVWGEWTRYYKEQHDYDIEVKSGISYHLESKGKRYDLVEYLNQRRKGNVTPEIWLMPELGHTEVFNEALFYNTLAKVITSIYKGNEVEVPDLSRLIV